MRIKKIQLLNYGPFFGEHEFVLENRGLTLVQGRNLDEPRMNSNGSGKSALFDALDWGLFGVIPRKDHIDSVVNEQASTKRGTVCSVVIEIEDDDGSPVRIARSRKKKWSG